MLSIFLEVILPVVLMVAVGGAAGRWRRVPVEPLSALTLYLFGPALVFDALSGAALPADTALRIVAAGVGLFFGCWAAALAWSFRSRQDTALRAAFTLTVTGINAGNMGLPVALFAFGEEGLNVAVVFMVVNTMLGFSAGILIASRASGPTRDGWWTPLRHPTLYAALGGFVANVAGVQLPAAVEAAVATLAGAAIPVMLVVLGLQLHGSVGEERPRDVIASNVLRLGISPLMMLGLTLLLGLEGVPQRALVVAAGMPTAVFTTILATEYSARPRFVTLAVASSTLASIATLTLLISLVE